MLELPWGKATVDQLAHRFGVGAETVEGWRDIALEGTGQSLRQGTGKSARELEVYGNLEILERAFTGLAIPLGLVERSLAERR